jgi:hypothetical protein
MRHSFLESAFITKYDHEAFDEENSSDRVWTAHETQVSTEVETFRVKIYDCSQDYYLHRH